MPTDNVEPPSLADRILTELRAKPDQKANEVARTLGVDRREVNRCLSHALAGRVVQDANYRWRLRAATAAAATSSAPSGPATELNRLCQYYLECVGQELEKGVSTFAASRYGEPDYAELPGLPQLASTEDWWNAPGVERVLSKVKADRANLQAWLGYPVRLREHRTPRWRGFFIEPLMLWPVNLPESPGDPYEIGDDLPAPNFAVLRSVAMGDASAVAEEAARLDEELGLNRPPEDRPDIDELLERLVNIRPDWDWREPIDPYASSVGRALAEITEGGIYNRAVILPAERSPFTRGLESELKALGQTDERRELAPEI